MEPRRALVTAAATCLLASLTAALAQTLTVVGVDQGQRIIVGNTSACTIAFNDPGAATSLTAAHCGRTGDRVRVEGPDGVSGEIGTLTRSERYFDGQSSNDWATIRWDDAAEVRPNAHSGDALVAPGELAQGDRICRYGASTQRTVCGSYIGRVGLNIYWDAEHGHPGDSGGPVWAEGKGFVAVYSGSNDVLFQNGFFPGGRKVSAERASAPVDGPVDLQDEEMRVIADYFSVWRPAAQDLQFR
ncbi:hypothetical protein [uncultured Corynebacterium sp.]|uniref:hypothetical protein n=1 Tax=uncultured Corynebacterium sp. TaxID=159447 RepID=UPI0025917393|nr:hypothetical protein [uncultured Corynebacterium sp.]